MASTVWFWITVIIVLLLILRFVRKYLGRILLLLLFLFAFFFIFKWINPRGAAAVSDRIKNLGVVITTPLTTLQGDNINSSSENAILGAIDQTVEKASSHEENSSRFARIFGKKKKSESLTVGVQGSEQTHPSTGDDSKEFLKPEDSDQQFVSLTGTLDLGTGETVSAVNGEKEVSDEEEETEEVIYIKSNPKPVSTKTSVPTQNSSKTTSSAINSSRGLSTEDLREADEIFGN